MDDITVTRDGEVEVVTINRPEVRNALLRPPNYVGR